MYCSKIKLSTHYFVTQLRPGPEGAAGVYGQRRLVDRRHHLHPPVWVPSLRALPCQERQHRQRREGERRGPGGPHHGGEGGVPPAGVGRHQRNGERLRGEGEIRFVTCVERNILALRTSNEFLTVFNVHGTSIF